MEHSDDSVKLGESAGSQDITLAAALASGQTQERAAELAGVSRSTVQRRLADPAFREVIADIRRAAVDRATGLLAEALADAVARLHLIVSSETEREARQASVAILDFGKQYLTDADLAERVRKLEEALVSGGPTRQDQPSPSHPVPAVPPGPDPVSE